ncbi:MAG TPA: FAD:protein FMN transferase [Spirochaetia bacterium]|nr:FAD:protein FMN transferase [Spirochaetia bacterium]
MLVRYENERLTSEPGWLRFESCGHFMGTTVTQRIYGENGFQACQKATREIVRLEGLMSYFIEDSEVSRLNRMAGRSHSNLR